MNEITLLRAAAPVAPPLRPAALHAARTALLAEIQATSTARPRRRFRLPGRKVTLRLTFAATAAAAAWTAAVVVAAPDSPSGAPDSVRLVAFAPPMFPLSLQHTPAGMTPAFSGDADAGSFADYRSAEGPDRFMIAVGTAEPDRPRSGEDQPFHATGTDTVSIGGQRVAVIRGWRDQPCEDGVGTCGRLPFAHLSWERRDDQWVTLEGEGRFGRTAPLLAVADSLVDRPQPVTLRVGLAPAGWSTLLYKDGRILILADDADPEQTVSVHLPLPQDVIPPDRLRSQLMGPVGPVRTVTVHGRPAQLVRIDAGGRDKGWYLQGRFADGTTFVVQAPETFTRDQVVAFAEQVTHSG